MAKKINPKDNQNNQKNANKGTSGTNKQYDKAQGNKGKQLNPNQKKKKQLCFLKYFGCSKSFNKTVNITT